MIKLSVSSMDTFDNCPKKYNYRYIEKVKVDAQPQAFTEFGSCAHLILELFHQRANKDTNPEDYSKIMKECFVQALKDPQFDPTILRSYAWSPTGDRPGLEYLKEISQSYLDKIKKDGMPNVIGTEVPYELELRKGVVIRGFIDRIDMPEPGHYRVIDYKTSKDPKYLKSFQLLVYSLAISNLYPDVEKISGSFMLLKHNFKEVDYNFGTMEIDNCARTIIKKADSILTEKSWKKNPTKLCDFCDYKNLCFGVWAEDEDES